jgi:acyl-CoA thioester hydrolase
VARREFKVRTKVRYSETDQMGVVYYANYLVWFELGRSSVLDQLGYPYDRLEEHGFILPAVHSEVRYLASAHYNEEIEIVSWVSGLKNVSVSFGHRVVRLSDGVLLAEGNTKHAVLSKTHKIIPLPDNLVTALKGTMD